MADYRDIWSPAKVFSPSTPRHQSQLAKDWSYVDQWLLTRFHPTPVPTFERNPTTLKALLALAAANEAADEERALEKKVKEKTLLELQKRDAEVAALARKEESILNVVEGHLTPDGTRALNSIALLSVALGSTSTSSTKLAEGLVELTKEEFSLEQQTQRIDGLHRRLKADLEALREQLRRMENGVQYKVPPELAGQIAEWTRTTRHLQNKTEDYADQVEVLESEYSASRAASGVTVEAVIEQEKAVLALKEHVLNLESQARSFQGLPPEKDLARLEVERVARELQELEERRERFYDGMVGS